MEGQTKTFLMSLNYADDDGEITFLKGSLVTLSIKSAVSGLTKHILLKKRLTVAILYLLSVLLSDTTGTISDKNKHKH